jgi:hypothetical protein
VKVHHAALFFILLLTGCALTPKTEIYHARDFSVASIKGLGVIKADARANIPLSTSQIAAMQFGVVGALIWGGIESCDNSIDEEGVVLHRKAFSLLRQRLGATQQISYKETDYTETDAVSLSKYIRNLRLYGEKDPTNDEIVKFSKRNQIDFVLYCDTRGGVDVNSDNLFMDSKWRIYNSNGLQVVSIFTRSISQKSSSDALAPTAFTNKMLELFSENTSKFISEVTNAELSPSSK